MKGNKILIIEGSADRKRGDLRAGFAALLGKALKGDMPRILMGNGKFQAIKKFKKELLVGDKFCFLLIDLDREAEFKTEELMELDLDEYKDWVFFMVQEVEAWFISQPKILDQHYKAKISHKLPKKEAQSVKKPSAILYSITKKLKGGGYDKIEDAIDLLKLLDAQQLRTDFEEFNRLIEKILNPNS